MLSNKFVILLILGILLISTGVAQAEKMHGLAMHGIPKYDKNFIHFLLLDSIIYVFRFKNCVNLLR